MVLRVVNPKTMKVVWDLGDDLSESLRRYFAEHATMPEPKPNRLFTCSTARRSKITASHATSVLMQSGLRFCPRSFPRSSSACPCRSMRLIRRHAALSFGRLNGHQTSSRPVGGAPFARLPIRGNASPRRIPS